MLGNAMIAMRAMMSATSGVPLAMNKIAMGANSGTRPMIATETHCPIGHIAMS